MKTQYLSALLLTAICASAIAAPEHSQHDVSTLCQSIDQFNREFPTTQDAQTMVAFFQHHATHFNQLKLSHPAIAQVRNTLANDFNGIVQLYSAAQHLADKLATSHFSDEQKNELYRRFNVYQTSFLQQFDTDLNQATQLCQPSDTAPQ